LSPHNLFRYLVKYFCLTLKIIFKNGPQIKFGMLPTIELGALVNNPFAAYADFLHQKRLGKESIYIWFVPRNNNFSEIVDYVKQIFTVVPDYFGIGTEFINIIYSEEALVDFRASKNILGLDLTFFDQELAEEVSSRIRRKGATNSIVTDLTEGNRYVCLCVRDEIYHSARGKEIGLESNLIFREATNNMRNSNINNYLSLIKVFNEFGLTVIRMGKGGIPSKLSGNIVDYANLEEQNLKNDLEILRNCEFVVSTGTGIDEVATLMFAKKVYNVNMGSFAAIKKTPQIPLILPKLFRNNTGEILRSEDYFHTPLFTKENYSLEESVWKFSWEDVPQDNLEGFSKDVIQLHYYNKLTRDDFLQNQFKEAISKLQNFNEGTFLPCISLHWPNFMGSH